MKKDYTIFNIMCLSAGNLYAFVIERTLKLQRIGSRNGMIIQLSAFCTPRMKVFQDIWFKQAAFSALSFFDDRPGKLFDNLQHIRVTITLLCKGKMDPAVATTNYIKFYSEFRPFLFQSIKYASTDTSRRNASALKVNSPEEISIIKKVWSAEKTIQYFKNPTANDNFVYYGYGYGYFGKILNKKSFFSGEKISESTGDKYYFIRDEFDKDFFVGILNTSLFYWFYIIYSDGHNFTKSVIGEMPVNYPDKRILKKEKEILAILMEDLDKKSSIKQCFYKSTGQVAYQEFYPKKSKVIIDSLDTIFAQEYKFSEKELDCIISYDFKFRMGDRGEN